MQKLVAFSWFFQIYLANFVLAGIDKRNPVPEIAPGDAAIGWENFTTSIKHGEGEGAS